MTGCFELEQKLYYVDGPYQKRLENITYGSVLWPQWTRWALTSVILISNKCKGVVKKWYLRKWGGEMKIMASRCLDTAPICDSQGKDSTYWWRVSGCIIEYKKRDLMCLSVEKNYMSWIEVLGVSEAMSMVCFIFSWDKKLMNPSFDIAWKRLLTMAWWGISSCSSATERKLSALKLIYYHSLCLK